MKKHISNYFKHHGYVCQEEIACEICGCPAVDIHHIEFGRHKRSDEVDNLIALCRRHHEDCHNYKIPIYFLKNRNEASIPNNTDNS